MAALDEQLAALRDVSAVHEIIFGSQLLFLQRVAQAQAAMTQDTRTLAPAASFEQAASWSGEDEKLAREVLAVQQYQMEQLQQTLAKKQQLRQQLQRLRQDALHEDFQQVAQSNALMLEHVVDRLEEQKKEDYKRSMEGLLLCLAV